MTPATRPTAGHVGMLPRVDLRPPAEIRRRSARAHARGWMLGAAAAVIVSALVVAGAGVYDAAESARLDGERTREQQLLAEVTELQPVSAALATRTALTTMTDQALAGDLVWSSVLTTLGRALPAGLEIIGLSLTAGPVPDGTTDPAEAVGTTGTLTLTGSDAAALVSAARELRATDGVRDVSLESVNNNDGTYTHIVTITLDQTIYVDSGDVADPEGSE